MFSHWSVWNWHCNRWVTSLKRFPISSSSKYLEKKKSNHHTERLLVSQLSAEPSTTVTQMPAGMEKSSFPLSLPVISYHGFCVHICCSDGASKPIWTGYWNQWKDLSIWSENGGFIKLWVFQELSVWNAFFSPWRNLEVLCRANFTLILLLDLSCAPGLCYSYSSLPVIPSCLDSSEWVIFTRRTQTFEHTRSD